MNKYYRLNLPIRQINLNQVKFNILNLLFLKNN